MDGPVSEGSVFDPDPCLPSLCAFLLSWGSTLAGSSLRANLPLTRGRVSASDLRHWYLMLRLKLRWDLFSRYLWARVRHQQEEAGQH
jgi:hypothetical protein